LPAVAVVVHHQEILQQPVVVELVDLGLALHRQVVVVLTRAHSQLTLEQITQ
jgi:hypothetical protein